MLFLVTQKNRIKAKAQSIDFLWRYFYHFINFSMFFADESQRDSSTRMHTATAKKYRFYIEKSFFVTENAANRLLLEVPYKEPL
jgi:hypothetical protein